MRLSRSNLGTLLCSGPHATIQPDPSETAHGKPRLEKGLGQHRRTNRHYKRRAALDILLGPRSGMVSDLLTFCE
jgi:hypothetical protein